MLQEIHVFRNPMPPREHLVQVTLISTVIRLNLVYMFHQKLKRAVARLDHHNSRVKQSAIVSRSRDLRHPEQEIDVSQDQQICIYEDDFVVISELP
uniref:Uncharacterized protein n=1 Tax=Brassica oleracea TaxID=3712 RepID=A0A3P6EMA5_BRAOL|nr:unnamed protein product [Brassica oleracea]